MLDSKAQPMLIRRETTIPMSPDSEDSYEHVEVLLVKDNDSLEDCEVRDDDEELIFYPNTNRNLGGLEAKGRVHT